MKLSSAFFLTLTIGLMSGVSSFSSAKSQSNPNTAVFPSTFAEFEKMTFEQMKKLPDIKWPVTKTATFLSFP